MPGSQPRPGGDPLRDALVALDELGVLFIAPVEAALLADGGRNELSAYGAPVVE